ncbi:acetyltransferase [Arthrobacter phage Argan]|nr:acetyltransferase [Arthrobacter phage Argan]
MAEVDEFLEHFGVKGMKWGKHKSENSTPKPEVKRQTASSSVKLKDGTTLTLSGDRTPPLARALAKLSPKLRQRLDDSHSFTLKTADGNDIGEMFLHKKNKDELNVVWVEVKENQRGRGYATGAMRGAIDIAKSQGAKKVTLEVPGISPDARHVYEKLGFKAGKQLSGEDDVWGGLTAMELKL